MLRQFVAAVSIVVACLTCGGSTVPGIAFSPCGRLCQSGVDLSDRRAVVIRCEDTELVMTLIVAENAQQFVRQKHRSSCYLVYGHCLVT